MAGLRLVAAALSLGTASPLMASPLEQWRPLIAEASVRFGVPQDWVGQVMQAESRGRANALSLKGAMGLMQLMPGTWADLRATLGLGADAYDPHDNILAGTMYLRQLYDRFGYPGMFAAYNAGPQRYADELAGRRALPLETRAYVAAVASVRAPPFAISSGASMITHASSSRSQASLFFPLSAAQSGQ